MSTKMPAALVSEAAEIDADAGPGARQARRKWIETALVVALTAAAVLCASFFAVVTGLV